MPVSHRFAPFYRSPEWKEIRQRILERERNRCQNCQARNGSSVERWNKRDRDGVLWMWWRYIQPDRRIFYRVGAWRNEFGDRETPDWPCGDHWTTRIQLGVAHLNQNPEDNDDANLAALCRRCHIMHDRSQHTVNSAVTRKIRKDGNRPILRMLEAKDT